ncbi:MAG TPA: penicillin acylase family protein, partial [Kofleriaceae bacterium]
MTITPSDPSGTVAVTGPTDFSAVIANDSKADSTVTWTVADGGAISTTTGLHTVFTPAPGAGGTATLTAATPSGLKATVKVAFGPGVLTSSTISTLLAPVTVLYDAEDIPHIKCATAIDCITVQGYIHARDRFFMMDFLRHVGRSNLAELIGVDGLSQDITIRTLFKTRDGKRLEEELVAHMDPTMLALITAYTSGVNAYLADLKAHPGNLPGEYKQLPFPPSPTDIADWSPADTMAVARLQQFQLSETLDEEVSFATFASVYAPGQTPPAPHPDLARYQAWIRSAAPKGEQAHTLSATPHTGAIAKATKRAAMPSLSPYLDSLKSYGKQLEALNARIRPFEATVGSNNWVISAAKSKTGKAMVANDPHLGLQYPPLFHLAAMTSANADDHLDLTGGAFPGIPGALVGRGQHVGWGVTVVGYDVTDIYQESGTFGPVPTQVIYKGAPEALVLVPETFLVRTANGLVNAHTLEVSGTVPGVGTVPPVTVIAPHHGPIIKILSNSIALSARWTGQEGNTQDLSAFYGLDTATDVDSAMVALKNYATGAQNFVLADDQGHIGYDPHALVPKRPWANESSATPHLPWLP